MDYALGMMIIVFLEGLVILKALLELSKQIDEGLEEMDSTMAEAIQNVIQNVNIGEPINPIQQALANVLTNSMTGGNPGSIIEVAQGPDGKFVGNE